MSKNNSSRTTVREKSDASIIEKYIRNDLTGTTFPIKLHIALKVLHNEGSEDIISWLPHGRSFKLHNVRVFEQVIMKRFFRQSKFSSFRRQLNLYGFQRVHHGRDIGSYYHRYFLRGKPQLAKHIVRESYTMQMYNHQRGRQQNVATVTDTERQGMVTSGGTSSTFDLNRSQDFYEMPHMGSVNDIAMIDHTDIGGAVISSRVPLRSSNEGGGLRGQSNVPYMNMNPNNVSMVGQSVHSTNTTDLMNHHSGSHQVSLQSPVGSCNRTEQWMTLQQQRLIQHAHALNVVPVPVQQQVQAQQQVQVKVQDMSATSALLRADCLPTRSLTASSTHTSDTSILDPKGTRGKGDQASCSSLPTMLSAEGVSAIALAAVALSSSISSLQGAVSSSVPHPSIQQPAILSRTTTATTNNAPPDRAADHDVS